MQHLYKFTSQYGNINKATSTRSGRVDGPGFSVGLRTISGTVADIVNKNGEYRLTLLMRKY